MSVSPAAAVPESGLAHLPLALFAAPMGIGGLGLAWRAAHPALGVPAWIGEAFLLLAGLVWLLLSVLHGMRALVDPSRLSADLQHPIRGSFAGAIGIGLLIMAHGVTPYDIGAARAMWLIAVVVQTLSGLWMVRVMFKTPQVVPEARSQVVPEARTKVVPEARSQVVPEARSKVVPEARTQVVPEARNEVMPEARALGGSASVTPALLIPMVGSFVAAVFGVALGYPELSWMLFGLGGVMWLTLQPMLFGRLASGPELPLKLKPSLVIMLSPPAVGSLALWQLTGSFGPAPLVLLGFAIGIAAVLASLYDDIAVAPFSMAWWSVTFPSAAFVTALIAYFQHSPVSWSGWLIWPLLIGVTAIVGAISLRTLRAALGGHLLRPEV